MPTGRSRHLVSVNPPSRDDPEGYHRYVGGSVEPGEAHRQAIVREVREELDAQVRDLTYLGVGESFFEPDGVPGHEIVFVYTGALDPAPPAEGGFLTEGQEQVPVVWRPLHADGDADADVPLYPTAVDPLLRALALDTGTPARPR